MRYALYTGAAAGISTALVIRYGYQELVYTIPVYVMMMIVMRWSRVRVAKKHTPRPSQPAVRRVACMCHDVPPPGCRMGHCPEMIFGSSQQRIQD